ncbi:unnamed protein product [Boreogadus saida]
MRRSDSEDYKNPTETSNSSSTLTGPIKYVEVLGGDMMSQSQSFRSCLSPTSEYSDFTFVKPSSTTDFKDMINVLDASLPDSTWTFESQQHAELYKEIYSPLPVVFYHRDGYRLRAGERRDALRKGNITYLYI